MVTENGQSDGNTSFLRAARNGQLEKVLEHLKTNIDINTSNANGLNALHLASKDGHVEIVEELLKRGAIVDAATKKGNTALHIASLAGQEEVVKLLVQNGASVNVQSQNGFTPLYMAAQENHDNVVKFLLANGANQSLSTEDGFTPLAVAMQQGHDKVVTVLLENDTRGKVRLPALHIAAKKDDVRAAKLLLENDHNPDVTSKSGFTPLHIASHYGNQPIANLLIQKGADVNYSAKHNITPLHVAAKWGKSNMVSLLLEQGAHIEAKTRDGLTPLHCAARSGHEQVVDMLLEKSAPISSKTKNGLAPLHMAAQGDHIDAARILLYHRAPVDEVTVDYLTALHVAAHCGHVRVAKLLLERQADANARALNGFTPLHIACKKNRIKVVELLLKHGACIGATTESGLTPLHVASFMGCMNIVIYLLQHDASPDIPTVRGETPLHLAARANQTDIIRILLRNNAQVDARAREQQTPLHIASRLGNVDIVMLLLQHGAKIDNTTKDEYTSLHVAAKEGQEEVTAVLIENGASLNATTKKGFTPLHLAAKYGHLKVAKLLVQKEAPVDAKGKNGVTPLHVASHYDHQNVALLLLEKGASPHAEAKNGHTPLHIAARKNQMDVAHTLLEYGAKPDVESKAGFTPLHLSSLEGHAEISSLLLEHRATPDYQSKNGLTPMHLCAQENKVIVAEILHKNGSNVNVQTKGGYTPLHIASHYGQADMVKFLLSKGANVKVTTSLGYTPLHQAAQQGHTNIVNILLENSAQPNALTNNGQTPLHIAQKLGYITVIDTLKEVTDTSESATPSEEKYRVVAPELMHETFISDSEEEGEDTLLGDQTYRYLTADEMKSLGDDSLPIDVTRDERVDSNRMVASDDPNAYPPRHIEDTVSPEHIHPNYVEYIKQAAYNVDTSRHPVNIGFLVSFLVDARGGAMRGCRHSGVRVIVPPRCAASPTRITCRYVRPQRTPHPPPLMEGEALASRVLELGPAGAKFLGPVIIEVPHFAALRGKEREIVILRSDNGESWKEHTVEATEDVLNDVLKDSFDTEDLNQLEDHSSGRATRIITQDFPQYFAVISRIRQEVHAIGPEGGMVSSTVVPQVQAVFPQGALTKKIKVGLQAQPIDPELTAKLLGHGVAVSPVVTVEPRRRKFHKAITLSMPAPRAHSQGMINQYSGSTPTLRLLCSITGGTSRAQWEDVTGSTPLTFVNDCVSFTTTVSARFWLMDCRNIGDATKMATELYREAIHVPFNAKFVVFAKRIDPMEARLRVFCMTDDKEDKTLEYQEQFTEIAKSRDVEVMEGKSQYIEFAGNLVPITKSGEQLQFSFRAFKENRLPFSVRVKDQHAEAVSRCLFMREPKVQKGEAPQQPICILNIVLPDDIVSETISLTDSESARKMYYANNNFDYYRQDPRLADISNLLGADWIKLATQLGLTSSEINVIKSEYPDSVAKQAQSMLRMWLSQSGNRVQMSTLENALCRIGREGIANQCLNLDNRNQNILRIKAEEKTKQRLINEDIASNIQHNKEEIASKKLTQLDKYSAEEKTFEPSDEEEEEDFNKTVPERREQIVKRLSTERVIPASSQRVEIVQEITSIKRQSLVEDKIAEVHQKANIDPTRMTMIKPVSKITQEKISDSEKREQEMQQFQHSSKTQIDAQNAEKRDESTISNLYNPVKPDSKDSVLLEEVTQLLGTKKPVTELANRDDLTSPKFSETPPPSPAGFIIEKQANTTKECRAKDDFEEFSKSQIPRVEEDIAEPFYNKITDLPQRDSTGVQPPKPKPRKRISEEKFDEKDRESTHEQIPSVQHDPHTEESEEISYQDKKRFWEGITQENANLPAAPLPITKPKRSSLLSSVESKVQPTMTGNEPAESSQADVKNKSDSVDTEENSSQAEDNVGYISDSEDVEHYISDSEIEDRVPQIRERQMSVFVPPSVSQRTRYERSASLPTEDLYEVSARSTKLRKQYYEEQIKKEMIKEQLTIDLEDEGSPERKSISSTEEKPDESGITTTMDFATNERTNVAETIYESEFEQDPKEAPISNLDHSIRKEETAEVHVDKSETEQSEKVHSESVSPAEKQNFYSQDTIPEITFNLSGRQRRMSSESDNYMTEEESEQPDASSEVHQNIEEPNKFDEITEEHDHKVYTPAEKSHSVQQHEEEEVIPAVISETVPGDESSTRAQAEIFEHMSSSSLETEKYTKQKEGDLHPVEEIVDIQKPAISDEQQKTIKENTLDDGIADIDLDSEDLKNIVSRLESMHKFRKFKASSQIPIKKKPSKDIEEPPTLAKSPGKSDEDVGKSTEASAHRLSDINVKQKQQPVEKIVSIESSSTRIESVENTDELKQFLINEKYHTDREHSALVNIKKGDLFEKSKQLEEELKSHEEISSVLGSTEQCTAQNKSIEATHALEQFLLNEKSHTHREYSDLLQSDIENQKQFQEELKSDEAIIPVKIIKNVESIPDRSSNQSQPAEIAHEVKQFLMSEKYHADREYSDLLLRSSENNEGADEIEKQKQFEEELRSHEKISSAVGGNREQSSSQSESAGITHGIEQFLLNEKLHTDKEHFDSQHRSVEDMETQLELHEEVISARKMTNMQSILDPSSNQNEIAHEVKQFLVNEKGPDPTEKEDLKSQEEITSAIGSNREQCFTQDESMALTHGIEQFLLNEKSHTDREYSDSPKRSLNRIENQLELKLDNEKMPAKKLTNVESIPDQSSNHNAPIEIAHEMNQFLMNERYPTEKESSELPMRPLENIEGVEALEKQKHGEELKPHEEISFARNVTDIGSTREQCSTQNESAEITHQIEQFLLNEKAHIDREYSDSSQRSVDEMEYQKQLKNELKLHEEMRTAEKIANVESIPDQSSSRTDPVAITHEVRQFLINEKDHTERECSDLSNKSLGDIKTEDEILKQKQLEGAKLFEVPFTDSELTKPEEKSEPQIKSTIPVDIHSTINQPQENIENTIWEVSVESNVMKEEKLSSLDTSCERIQLGTNSASRFEDNLKSDKISGSSKLNHEDQDSDSSAKLTLGGHDDMKTMILESLHQQQVDPDEAKLIAESLIEEIESELQKVDNFNRGLSSKSESLDSERHLTDYLKELAETKGLEQREVELVESVLERRKLQISRLNRGDTQASSMEITDEDLRYSETDYDYSTELQQQMGQLAAESSYDMKNFVNFVEDQSNRANSQNEISSLNKTSEISDGNIERQNTDDSYRQRKDVIMEEDENITESSVDELDIDKSELKSKLQTEQSDLDIDKPNDENQIMEEATEEKNEHTDKVCEKETARGDNSESAKENIQRTSSSDSKSSLGSNKTFDDVYSTCSSGKKQDVDTSREVVLRKSKKDAQKKGDRISGIELETNSSSGESRYHSFEIDSKSRPSSSDIEGIGFTGSSEYESALNSQEVSMKSQLTSGEYHTAMSSLSSKESMMSIESESSGNLASIEVSETSETLVPSSSDLEADIDMVDQQIFEENDLWTASECDGKEVADGESQDSFPRPATDAVDIPSKMKRSHEMTFQPEPRVLASNSPQTEPKDIDDRFGSSVDEVSGLSMSPSSTSSAQLRTVIELSRTESVGPEESSTSAFSDHFSLDDDNLTKPPESITFVDSSTSTYQTSDKPIESITILSASVNTNGTNNVCSQVTTETVSSTIDSQKSNHEELKKKGHRRQDSTSFIPTLMSSVLKSSESQVIHEMNSPEASNEKIEREVHDLPIKRDYSERRDSHGKSSSTSSEKSSFEEAEAEAAFSMVAHISPVHKIKQICPIFEDIDAEKIENEAREAIVREREERAKQVRDSSPGSIPHIEVTEHMAPLDESNFRYPELEIEREEMKRESTAEEIIEKEIEAKTSCTTENSMKKENDEIKKEETSKRDSSVVKSSGDEERASDSPNSDSFELVETPDIIDDFVVIEEIGKEANEMDSEGKSMAIQTKPKSRRKKDDDIHLARSDPTPLSKTTEMKYFPPDNDLDFEFEDSPPQADGNSTTKAYGNRYDQELEANRKWIEQQFHGDSAAMAAAGYGYEMEFERGPLEDIKEEDINDIDQASSRIGSLGSQKESGGSLGSYRDSYSSTPEYDVLAGRRYFTRSGEHDDVSMSSLQEFENLERAMSLETKKLHLGSGSQESSSNGSFRTRYYSNKGQCDDISVSSLKEFEGLEKACIAAHRTEIKVKEEEELLSQIDELQESQPDEPEKDNANKDKAIVSEEEDYEKRMFEIDEIIRQAQNNVERFVELKEAEKTESLGRGDSIEEVSKVPDLDLDTPLPKADMWRNDDPMVASTDSLDLDQTKPAQFGSTDSLDQKNVELDAMTTSTDSIELNNQISRNITSDSIENETEGSNMVCSDSLNIAAAVKSKLQIDSLEDDDQKIFADHSSSDTGKDFSSSARDDAGDEKMNELMLGSTDSLEPTSSTATHATYQYETDSVFSGSFTSEGSNTMVSSTDTIDPNVTRECGDIEAAVQQAWLDRGISTSTAFFEDTSRPYVTEVIEPSDDPSFSHTIHRTVKMPVEVKKITFHGKDAEGKLEEFMREFGEHEEEVHETEETDSDGNVHIRRVVQKRFVVRPEDEASILSRAREDLSTNSFPLTSLTKTMAGESSQPKETGERAVAKDQAALPKSDKEEDGSSHQPFDQHQLSEEMKALLKEMEEASKEF